MDRSAPDVLERIVRALEERGGQLTAEQAAQLAGRSKSRIRHVFTPCAGMYFRTARLRARMKTACDLLAESRLTMPQIAAKLGYSDRTKFEKAFKRVFGITPTQYRRQDAPRT